jgi:SAM-dependent methyltransferase
MDSLPFQNEELDLIWSEGAIYNIGFERGLNEWRKYLKPGGYIAVSESSWFTDERPSEINDFWMDAYPEIDTISNQVAKVHKAGYLPVATFILPENCWTEHYFTPKIKAKEIFLNKYSGNKTAEELIVSQRYEEELYNKYKEFYGYVFFIAKKVIQ